MVQTRWRTDEYITTWSQFDERIRSKGYDLLKRLDEFPNSILVTGCQRSGTTMLSRIITQSDGMVNYWFGPDDELDAALILCGYVEHQPEGRYCFQTTFINRRHHEYYEYSNGHRILFVVRNPFSVVYSMLYNWKDEALNRLFQLCGIPLLDGTDEYLYKLFGKVGISRLRRACWSYAGKMSQLFELHEHMGPAELMVLDYDDLVVRKEIVLPAVYDFIDLPYYRQYAERIHSASLDKAERFSRHDKSAVEAICEPVYQRAMRFTTAV